MIKWKELKSKIPHLVTFKRKSYEVCWIDNFKDEHVMGETRFNPRQIVIKNGLSDRETCLTYLHEVMHAVSHECGAELTETQVRVLENMLTDILKKGNIFKE